MKKLFLFFSLLSAHLLFASEILPFKVAVTLWKETLGNHRAVIEVKQANDAVRVNIPWRRRDVDAAQKALIITDANGSFVKNIYRIDIDREKADFVFQPLDGAGIYYVYYMPWKGTKDNGSFNGDYLKPEPAPEPGWVARHHLSSNDIAPLVTARVIAIESRTAFDSFFPMEIVATKKEMASLLKKYTSEFLLFPEDRRYPIRMTNDLPYKWIQSGPSDKFGGSALRNEYYVFQLGLYAAQKDLHHVQVNYGNAPFQLTSFNLEGVDSKGNYFNKQLDVSKGTVQALWFGVDIPKNALPGLYTFYVTVKADNTPAQKIQVKINVQKDFLKDRGDSELWRHSRLRWLNSTLGIDDKNVEPFRPLQLENNTIKASMSTVALNETGLPFSIKASGKEILQRSLSFIVETEKGIETLRASGVQFTKQVKGKLAWESIAANEALQLICKGSMEDDGYLTYQFEVIPKENLFVKDVRLELPVKKTEARYFMGMGLPGTQCPPAYNWMWKGPQDAYWIGNADAGIFCELQGATYRGPLLNLYHPAPPPSWHNKGNGGFSIVSYNESVVCNSYSGVRNIKAGDSLNFEFALLITPVKKINSFDQFTNRYYHNGSKPAPSQGEERTGIKIINVHHANTVNPYINYPFISSDSIKRFTKHYHDKGMKVKLYYTIRELTNQITELWALRSLGNEVLADGSGGGYVWLREHLGSNYNVQWFTPINGYEASDAAILTSGDSRWYNYYIEGLKWLVEHTDIDGFYLDDVSYDRQMLKRMRKVMDGVKPGCILDLHSNTGFSKGPATQYTEFFPYINKVWFGESFQYDKMPAANWLVEVSGIPFGLMGDMLHAGGNPWRGMVYGMTVRYPWFTEGVNCDPQSIWSIWDEFGIAQSKMVGYWNDKRIVTTSNPDVLATAFVKDDRMLIALASWAKDTATVTLNIDWNKTGWKPKGKIKAPDIENYQPEKSFSLKEPITIPPKKGWILIVEK